MLLVKATERCVLEVWFKCRNVAIAGPHIVRAIAVTTSEFTGLGGAPTVAGALLTTPVDVLQISGDDDDDDDDVVELATAESSALRCFWAARMLRMRATIAWLWLRLARASFVVDVVVVVVVVDGAEDLDIEDVTTGGGVTRCRCAAKDWTTAALDDEV